MRVSSMLRSATLALSLMATLGVMSTVFAGHALAAQQQTQQSSSASPYDSPNFTIPESQIYN
jgi:hypothetical protein